MGGPLIARSLWPVSIKLAALLAARRDDILTVVERAAGLAQSLRIQSPEFVLCHSDVHAANILIEAGGALYIVDWDDPVFAPKERDLMFIGGAQVRSSLERDASHRRGTRTRRAADANR